MIDEGRASFTGRLRELRRRIRWDYLSLALLIPLFVTLSLLFPDRGGKARQVAWEYFKEMVVILPAVLVIMGLVTVWVERQFIVKYLGEESGLKGIILSFVLGSIPMGPLYIAFPLAAVLLKKGAKVSNMIIFLSAWACIKIPIEVVEFQFLGWKFALTRYLATLLVVVVLSEVIGRVFFKGGYRSPVERPEEASG